SGAGRRRGSFGGGRAARDARAAGGCGRPHGRALPQAVFAETGGQELRRDSRNPGSGFHQHDLHLGLSLPQTSAGADGRRLGGAQMTNDEIRKLLGGYATNTLTEAERKSLFEAALENQEVFDALQEEQALKELLADPVSRVQVRQALEKPRA